MQNKKNSNFFHLPHVIMQIVDFYGNIKMAYNSPFMDDIILCLLKWTIILHHETRYINPLHK
jgi:hypothetical protein